MLTKITKLSTDNLQLACIEHMQTNGFTFSEQLIADGKIHRFSIDNNRHKLDEWYIAYEGISGRGNPYLSCTYGSWSAGNKYSFKSWLSDTAFDKNERRQLNEIFKQKQQETTLQLKKQHDITAQKASDIWQQSSPIAPTKDYLRYSLLKGIDPIGEKFGLNSHGYPSMIIDIRNIDGQIRSLQYISADINDKSYKTFLDGGEIKGNFHTIGNIEDGSSIMVTEGYATGASVYRATGNATVVALSANGLQSIVEQLRKKYPNSTITIAGDCDEIGLVKAKEAAKNVGCKVVFPAFPQEQKPTSENSNEKNYTDFNDLHKIYGIDEVTKQLSNAVAMTTVQDDLKNIAYNLLEKKDPCCNFYLSELPKPLGDYISAICEATNAHPIMITSSVLTTIAAFLGLRVFIPEGEYFQTLYPNLWLLNITKSGQFKSTALNKGARLAWKKNLETSEKIKHFKASLCKTDDNDEEEDKINELLLNISRENILLPNKITAEALLEHLSQGHHGVILASEFGGWLQNLEKTHNNDLKAIFTEFYDVPPSFRYKTRTQGDLTIENPYLCICGVSTLAWLKPSIKASDVASGFFARFLIFAPPPQDDIPPALPTPNLKTHHQAEQTVWDILENMDEYYSYKLSASAKKLFKDLHGEIYKIQKSYSEKCQEILEPYLKRWSPSLLKLAMIMQLFENPESKEIENKALLAAVSILLPAIRSTAYLFEGELGESDCQRKCRILLEWICKNVKELGKPVKRQAILQSKQLDGGVAEYDPILQMLIESGKLDFEVKQKKNESLYWPKEQLVDEVGKSK